MAKQGYKRKKHPGILVIIGANIRMYRLKMGLSQEKLAILCDMEPTSISRYEAGLVDISSSSVAIIAEELKIEPYQLLIPIKKPEEA
ncbi:helix-turn-helix domain-containing protein [Pedobacter sp. L105]|uniref:helix-turn-helix domain-containing protein n=1 Tax=Pedobacter sp. L105 TaxID=1641871 RepID=UPI00131BD521|nr:helix-turn-helix transcriptional regulator [Pedobacter sp. L105]